MKWLLLAVLVMLVASASKGGRLQELVRSIRRLPQAFRDGQTRVDTPEQMARDVTPKDVADKKSSRPD